MSPLRLIRTNWYVLGKTSSNIVCVGWNFAALEKMWILMTGNLRRFQITELYAHFIFYITKTFLINFSSHVRNYYLCWLCLFLLCLVKCYTFVGMREVLSAHSRMRMQIKFNSISMLNKGNCYVWVSLILFQKSHGSQSRLKCDVRVVTYPFLSCWPLCDVYSHIRIYYHELNGYT